MHQCYLILELESKVLCMIVKELNFPIVYDGNRKIGYGGNQDWFPGKWQRKAGCGSTSGANIAAYYAANCNDMVNIYTGDITHFDQNEYIKEMEEMYKYMTPGPFGYPYVSKFAEQFVLFCKERGISLTSHIYEKFKSTEGAYEFVKENIQKEIPIALLILFHRAPELKEDNWHWITITGYEEDENGLETSSIILSNCGERQKVKTNVLFEVHPKNTLSMIAFDK